MRRLRLLHWDWRRWLRPKGPPSTAVPAGCVTAFFIHQLRWWGAWSPIHLLAVFVLVMLPGAVIDARRHRISRHRHAMRGLFLGALVIAGAFTFAPGRIMHAVVFGP